MFLLFGFSVERVTDQEMDHRPEQVGNTSPSQLYSLPGYQGVSPSQCGRVELKYGGDVIPIGHRHEGVHDFVLDVSQTGS